MNSNGHTLIRRPVPLLVVELSEYSIALRLDRRYLARHLLSSQPTFFFGKNKINEIRKHKSKFFLYKLVPYINIFYLWVKKKIVGKISVDFTD